MIKLLKPTKQMLEKIGRVAKSIEYQLRKWWSGKDDKIDAIKKAISLSENDFSLCIALYESRRERNQLIEKITRTSKAEVITVRLKPSTREILTEIVDVTKDRKGVYRAIFVTDVETANIEDVFQRTNENRESFYKVKAPIVIWCNRKTVNRIADVAPELINWAGTPL